MLAQSLTDLLLRYDSACLYACRLEHASYMLVEVQSRLLVLALQK